MIFKVEVVTREEGREWLKKLNPMDSKSYQKWWEGVVMRNNGDGQGRKVLLVQQESTLGRGVGS